MTGTLERHFGQRLIIRVMSARVGREWYLRRVVLARQDSGGRIPDVRWRCARPA